MANETTSTTLDDMVKVIHAETRLNLAEGDLTDLTQYIQRYNLQPGQGSIKVPKLGAITASAVTEGSSASNQSVSSSGVTLSPSTGAVAKIALTDVAAFSTDFAINVGKQFARAIKLKRNKDLVALFSSLSVGLGTADTDITEALILSAKTKLEEKGATDLTMPVPPRVYQDIASIYGTNSNMSAASIRELIISGKPIELFGVKIVTSNAFTEASGDYTIAMFDRNCFAMATMWDIKIETQRDAGAVSTIFVASSSYKIGEVEDGLGVKLVVDGA